MRVDVPNYGEGVLRFCGEATFGTRVSPGYIHIPGCTRRFRRHQRGTRARTPHTAQSIRTEHAQPPHHHAHTHIRARHANARMPGRLPGSPRWSGAVTDKRHDDAMAHVLGCARAHTCACRFACLPHPTPPRGYPADQTGVFAGVELDDPVDVGNDGSVGGQYFFSCNVGCGLFASRKKVRRRRPPPATHLEPRRREHHAASHASPADPPVPVVAGERQRCLFFVFCRLRAQVMLVKKAKGNPADDVSEFDEDIAAGQSSKLRGLAQLASSTSTDEPPANYINVGGEGESDDGGEADTQAMREQRDRSLPQGWKAFDDPKSGLCPGRWCTCGPHPVREQNKLICACVPRSPRGTQQPAGECPPLYSWAREPACRGVSCG